MFNLSKGKKDDKNEQELDMNNIPKHIGIIMDGNGRWAKARNLPRTMGHRAGVETIRVIIKECERLGVEHLTLYAFSTENWKRPKKEVGALMKLLVEYLKNELKELHENNVIITYIGDISALPKEAKDEVIRASEYTKENTGVNLNVALNYGGREEIIHGVRSVLEDILNEKFNVGDLNEESFKKYLYTGEIDDPELIIRPSGEFRLSNFLLYQGAYSELWFNEIFWPDFREKQLREAILDYQNRERRFGGIKDE